MAAAHPRAARVAHPLAGPRGPALRARRVSALAAGLVLLLALCASSSARAQTQPVPVQCTEGRCIPSAALQLGPMPGMPGPAQRLARLTRGTAIFGVVSAALALSGSIALGMSDSQHVERVGRSVMLGLDAVTTPLIALSSLITRRRAHVKGLPTVRSLMWVVYLSALTTDGFFVYRAFHADQVSLGVSIAAGAVSAVTALGYAYDAFQTSREAASSRYALRISPGGAALRLRF